MLRNELGIGHWVVSKCFVHQLRKILPVLQGKQGFTEVNVKVPKDSAVKPVTVGTSDNVSS